MKLQYLDLGLGNSFKYLTQNQSSGKKVMFMIFMNVVVPVLLTASSFAILFIFFFGFSSSYYSSDYLDSSLTITSVFVMLLVPVFWMILLTAFAYTRGYALEVSANVLEGKPMGDIMPRIRSIKKHIVRGLLLMLSTFIFAIPSIIIFGLLMFAMMYVNEEIIYDSYDFEIYEFGQILMLFIASIYYAIAYMFIHSYYRGISYEYAIKGRRIGALFNILQGSMYAIKYLIPFTIMLYVYGVIRIGIQIALSLVFILFMIIPIIGTVFAYIPTYLTSVLIQLTTAYSAGNMYRQIFEIEKTK